MHPAKLPTAVGCSQRDPGPWHKLGATLDLCPLCLGSGQPKVPCGLADGSAMLFIAAQNPASAQAPSVPVGTLRSIGSVVKYKNTRAMHIFKKEKKKKTTTKQKNKNLTGCTGVCQARSWQCQAGQGWLLLPSPLTQHHAALRTHMSAWGPFFILESPRTACPKSLLQCLSQTWALCLSCQALSQAKTRLHRQVDGHRPCCVLSPTCLQHRWAAAAFPAV